MTSTAAPVMIARNSRLTLIRRFRLRRIEAPGGLRDRHYRYDATDPLFPPWKERCGKIPLPTSNHVFKLSAFTVRIIGGHMPLKKISIVSVPVTDQDRAKQFY